MGPMTFVLIAQAVFRLEHGNIDRHTYTQLRTQQIISHTSATAGLYEARRGQRLNNEKSYEQDVWGGGLPFNSMGLSTLLLFEM